MVPVRGAPPGPARRALPSDTLEHAMASGGDEAAIPRRARRADATRNAESLLSAARQLFRERGTDVALDDVARRAGVGNATLYRHFPTRGDLLVAVYADEAANLCRRGRALADECREPSADGTGAPLSAADALFRWLDAFAAHMASKPDLARAVTSAPGGRGRAELLDEWHESMRSTASALLARAREAGAVRDGVTVDDLLLLTGAAALAGTGARHAARLVGILRYGVESRRPS